MNYLLKVIFLAFRRLFYAIAQKGRFSWGRNLTIHPNAKLAASQNSEIVINNNCSMAALCIIVAQNGANVNLGENVSLSRGVQIYARKGITIGEGTMIGNNTCIFDHDHDYKCTGGVRANTYIENPIKIGKNVWIGCNAVILRGTVLGDNCVVGAGAIIKGHYQDNSLIIQKRTETVCQYKS